MRERPASILHNSTLGEILVRYNARARRIIFRCDNGQLICTAPPCTTLQKVSQVAEEMKERLSGLVQRGKASRLSSIFTPTSTVQVDGFAFSCRQADGRPRVTENAQGIVFLYPAELDWQNPSLQQWLTHVVEESLRRRAKRMLIPRLEALASQRGLTPRKVSIHRTTSRWGSCSTMGNIHLSLYLMLLPSHLQDFIIHHELTHLQEMNHGPRFHALLDKAVNGVSHALEKEMKKYRPALKLQ